MLKCPFCSYDYSEHGLRDGRCPGCGSVLAWEGGSGDVPDSVREAVFAQTMQSIRPGIRLGPTPSRSVAPNSLGAERTDNESESGKAEFPAPPSRLKAEEAFPANGESPTDGVDDPSSAEKANAPDVAHGPEKPDGDDEDVDQYLASLVERPPDVSSEILRTITPAALTPSEMEGVSENWKLAAEADDVRPSSTLKGRGGGRGTDTALVIQTRSVVNKRDNPSLPVEAEYELLDVIGQGGVGVVYLARQSSIDRDVAVKMLRTDRVEDVTNRDKFLAEAVVTGDLDHPNIVPVYDLGTDPSGALFYSMKRVQGTPWSEVIGRRSLTQNLEILLKVSDAIAFAHARGIVHRDIKPENVMLGDFGEVLVMDWGIALPLDSYSKSSGFLRSQGLGGSPAYMSPEMVTGPVGKIGPASDIYLLGATLFEILTGRPPHRGRNVMECLMAAARNDIVATDISGELLEIALRALATRPADRYRSVLAFQAAIRDYESHAESIALSTRAAEDLRVAEASRSYDDFSRSVFAFQESLALWGGNKAARSGIDAAKRAYAESALSKGDYDLGLSLLDPTNHAHDSLRQQLIDAAAERDARQNRLTYVKRLMGVLVIVLFVGGTAAILVNYNSLLTARQAESDAKKSAKTASDKEKEAKIAAELANRARDAATKARGSERAAKIQAVAQRAYAEDARQKVEESAYVQMIGFAAAKIKSNAFDVAREILGERSVSPTQAADATQAADTASRQARYRHWEWGRLRFLCRDGLHTDHSNAVRAFATPWAVSAFALAPDDQTLVLASRNGRMEIRSRDNELLAELTFPKREARTNANGPVEGIVSLAISSDGQLLVAGGAAGTIAVWERQEAQRWKLLVTLDHDDVRAQRREVRQVAFSPKQPFAILTAVDRVLHRWDAVESAEGKSWRRSIGFFGHLDRIWAAAYSADGTVIASGGEDGAVRIWDAASGAERARLTAHEGAVYSVAFAPNGAWCASAGFDRRVLLWDMAGVGRNRRSGDQAIREIQEFRAGNAAIADFLALEGHSASIRSLAFSQASDVLVSAGQDNTAIVWKIDGQLRPSDEQTRESRLRKVLRSHGSWIQHSAVSSDGETVFTSSNDGTWRRWNVAAYDETRVFHDAEHTSVIGASFLPQGDKILTAHSNGVARLWDAATGREIGEFSEGHEFLTSMGRFLPDGRRAFTIAGDGTIRIWDLESRVEIGRLQGTGRRAIAALSTDGRRALTAGPYGTVRWWDVDTHQLLATLPSPYNAADTPNENTPKNDPGMPPPEVSAVAISDSGDRFLTGDSLGRCWLWNADEQKPRQLAAVHREAVAAAYLLPESDWRKEQKILGLSLSIDGQLRLWRDDGASQSFEIAESVDASRLSLDGKYLVVAGSLGERRTGVWWWSVGEQKVAARAEFEGKSVNAVDFPRSGELRALLTTSDLMNSQMELLEWPLANADVAPRTLRVSGERVAPWGDRVWHADESADGKRLLTVGENSASLWDRASGRLVANFRVHTTIVAFDVSPDGKWLVTAGSEGAVKLWDIETRHAVRRLDGAGFSAHALSHVEFSPDGRWIVIAGARGVELWDREREKLVGVGDRDVGPLLAADGGGYTVARFTPDGQHLLTAAENSAATLWRLAPVGQAGQVRVERIREFRAGGRMGDEVATVRAAAFSTDGRWLATGGDDRLVRFWAAADGRLLAIRGSHSEPVGALEFSADGLRVLSGSDDGRAMLWDTRSLPEIHERMLRSMNEDEAKARSDSAPEILTLSHYRSSGSDAEGDAANQIERTHGGRVRSVAFSPRGNDVLTAGEDGSAFLWPGLRLTPALQLSLGTTKVTVGESARHVDPQAMVSYPTIRLLEQVELTVRPETVGMGNAMNTPVRFSVVPLPMTIGHWELDGEVIRYRSPLDAESRVVGAVRGGGEGIPLTIRLEPGAPGQLLELLTRSVAVASAIEPRSSENEAAEPASSAVAPAETANFTLRVYYQLTSGSGDTKDGIGVSTDSHAIEIETSGIVNSDSSQPNGADSAP
ncbi:MAG: protein kinase [Pirellulales bacterium]